MSLRWFNASAPMWRHGGRMVRLWTLFNRRSTEGHWWGLGLVQVGNRHLVLVSRTQGYPEREVWAVQLGFLRLV
jgi:hypothetical protein